jgi:hypothetical protein
MDMAFRFPILSRVRSRVRSFIDRVREFIKRG